VNRSPLTTRKEETGFKKKGAPLNSWGKKKTGNRVACKRQGGKEEDIIYRRVEYLKGFEPQLTKKKGSGAPGNTRWHSGFNAVRKKPPVRNKPLDPFLSENHVEPDFSVKKEKGGSLLGPQGIEKRVY